MKTKPHITWSPALACWRARRGGLTGWGETPKAAFNDLRMHEYRVNTQTSVNLVRLLGTRPGMAC